MFVVTVEFRIEGARVQDFRHAMVANAKASLENEPGCTQFDVCYDPGDEQICYLYELYTDEAAFKVHLAAEHFKAFDAKVGPWLTSKNVRTFERAWPA